MFKGVFLPKQISVGECYAVNNPLKLVYAVGFASYLIAILHFTANLTTSEGINQRKYNVVETPSISWSPQ